MHSFPLETPNYLHCLFLNFHTQNLASCSPSSLVFLAAVGCLKLILWPLILTMTWWQANLLMLCFPKNHQLIIPTPFCQLLIYTSLALSPSSHQCPVGVNQCPSVFISECNQNAISMSQKGQVFFCSKSCTKAYEQSGFWFHEVRISGLWPFKAFLSLSIHIQKPHEMLPAHQIHFWFFWGCATARLAGS